MAIVGRKILDVIHILEVDLPPYITGATAPVGSIAILTDGSEICTKRGASDYDWGPITSEPGFNEFEDFNFSALGSTSNRYAVVAATANGGTTAVEAASVGSDYTGLVTASTGTTSNNSGRSAIDFFNSQNRIRTGNFPFFYEFRVRIPVLSGTPSFTVEVGLVDGNGAGDPANGIYFTYTNSVNSGRWRATTRAASTSTNVDSTVTVVANTWHRLGIYVPADSATVYFYVDGSLIGTSVSNIPANTSMRFIGQIQKSSTSTTSRSLNLDYVYWRLVR